MSEASPQDLAVAFRSVPRRLREAAAEVPPQDAAPIRREIEARVADAAGLLHAPSDPALVADAIEAVRADGWEGDTLPRLRTIALELGGLLRRLAALAPG